MRDATEYLVDAWQRAILFWDVLRERGNQYLEHERSQKPPVLVFDQELVLDGRNLPRPANYALLRIKPGAGDPPTDAHKRPFLVIDPRAGHGPGIGGFKIDSEIGIALKQGHPCYFVTFFPQPVPGQTIESVCAAEIAFLRRVNELHPQAEGGPFLIGNCQGGWALMMLAALIPDEIGPILLAGSPLSYWAGVVGKNPMRYSGGLHVDGVAARRPGPRQVRRRAHRQQLREPRPRQHLLEQALQPLRQGRHRAAALPAVREMVGRPLPDEPRGDGLDRPEAVRRQQAHRR
jgi:pimeloyl-ACP methyl ester carboxylesterase